MTIQEKFLLHVIKEHWRGVVHKRCNYIFNASVLEGKNLFSQTDNTLLITGVNIRR